MHKLFAYFSDSGHLLWATMLALSLQKSKCAHFCIMNYFSLQTFRIPIFKFLNKCMYDEARGVGVQSNYIVSSST